LTDGARLVSWKRIARYLDRGERTVRRWAAEDGLPVHRMSERRNSSVFALASEIDAWLQQRPSSPTRKSDRTRIVLAVLPVANLGNPKSFEAIVDGLTEETISALGQISELGVIARTSIMMYKTTSQSITEIGKALNSQYIIEGSMRTEHNIARVTMQLITVADQTHLWAKNYEHSLDSPMALQRELAQRIASDVGLTLAGKRPTLGSLDPTINRPGAEEYFHGRFFLNQLTAESLRKSVAAFDRAIALEPEFGPAYGGKAEALQLLTNFSQTSPADVMPEAINAINSALAFAPNSAEVFASLGYIHTTYSREWAAGERAFQQSLALNPSLATAHQWYAEALANLGRFDEALEQGQEAHRLDPLSVAVECSVGHVLWLARRYDELLAAMDRVLSKEPAYPLAHILKFSAHFEQGHYAAALDTCQTALGATGEPMPFVMLSMLARGANGEPDQIFECLNMLEQQAKQTFVSHFFFAMLSTALGEAETAIEHLEKACDEGVWHVTMLGQSAMFDRLRRSERFDALLRKIGLYESRYTGEAF